MKYVIITAGCIINDEMRRGIPILIPNGDVIHCIPLYPTILEDRNRLTTGTVFLRGTCIGGGVIQWRAHHICEGNGCTAREHGIGVLSIWP